MRDFLQDIPELADAGRIQPVGGLVKDQQLWPVKQSLGHAQPLPHAQRIFPDGLVNPVFQPHQTDHFFYAFICDAGPHVLVQLQVLPAAYVAVCSGFSTMAPRCAMARS